MQPAAPTEEVKDEMKTATLTSKNNKAAPTLDEFIQRYELNNCAGGKSPRTISWYNDILKSFTRYLKGERYRNDISSFNVDGVRGYILYLSHKPKFAGHPYTPKQSENLSPQTIRCHTRALKAFSTWLYLDGHTTENRLKNLKLPKAPIRVMEPLSPEETKKIIASINRNAPTGLRNHAIFVTSLDNGLRVSEIAGITIEGMNLQAGYIKVMGKGSKERVVPIGKFVQMTLWHYSNRVRPKPADPECENLFLSRNGKPITANTIKIIFSRLAKGSGVRRLHAHLCRHTFAINYLLNGGDIFSLREILGHTTLDMVNHYLHFTSSQITAQHHKYSPMDKLQGEDKEASGITN